MKILRVFLLIFIVIFVYSCQKESASPDVINDEPGISNINKSLLLELVNNVRSRGCNCGSTVMPPVPVVGWNNQLENAAIAHSSDMNENKYFNHTSLNGASAGDRIRNAGYNWITYGENIAYNYPTENAVIDGWLNSEGHCKNIMNGNFKEMGVAKVGVYWTQEFGTR